MAEIQQIVDITGNVRRLGSLAPDPGKLKALLQAAGQAEEYTDEQIRKMLTDPDRVAARLIFTDEWICNQLSFGSCNGWATAEAIARGTYRRGFKDCPKRLSGSYVYAWINGNQDNGSGLSDGQQAAALHGAPPEEMVPANLIYRRQMPAGADAEAAKHKGFLLVPLPTLRALRTALAKQDPCIVAVHAGGNFQRLNSDGVAGVDNGMGNHAVVVDDSKIVAGKEVFDMANSWGLGYGTKGRAYLTESHFRQTMNVHGFWTLRSTVETA